MNYALALIAAIVLIGCGGNEASVDGDSTRGGGARGRDSTTTTLDTPAQVLPVGSDTMPGGIATGGEDYLLVGTWAADGEPTCRIEHSPARHEVRVIANTQALERFAKVVNFVCSAALVIPGSPTEKRSFALQREMLADTEYVRTFTVAPTVAALDSATFAFAIATVGTHAIRYSRPMRPRLEYIRRIEEIDRSRLIPDRGGRIVTPPVRVRIPSTAIDTAAVTRDTTRIRTRISRDAIRRGIEFGR